MLGHLLRRAREPFASLVEVAGFASAISTTVRSARRIIENSPDVVGPVAVRGVREEGTLWFVGQAAEETRARLGVDARRPSGDARAFIAARVFEVVAYHHPYFDGNKRTAFLASTLVGYYLGLAAKAVSYEVIEDAVRDLTAREATHEEVAAWFLSNLFITRDPEEA